MAAAQAPSFGPRDGLETRKGLKEEAPTPATQAPSWGTETTLFSTPAKSAAPTPQTLRHAATLPRMDAPSGPAGTPMSASLGRQQSKKQAKPLPHGSGGRAPPGSPTKPMQQKSTSLPELGNGKGLRRAKTDAQAGKLGKLGQKPGEEDALQLRKLLVSQLKGRFGDLVVGWRSTFDVFGEGQCSFANFCTVLRNLGLDYYTKPMWHSLDSGRGVLSLACLAPEAESDLDHFFRWACAHFEDGDACWRRLDHKGQNQVAVDELCDALTALEYPQPDSRKRALFYALRRDVRVGYLGYGDIFRSGHRENGDFRRVRATYGIQLDPSRVIKEVKEPEPERKWRPHLEAFLKRRFGSVVRGWLRGLDPRRVGRLGFNELCFRLRTLSYSGHVKPLWRELADSEEATHITLGSLDKRAEELIATLRSKLRLEKEAELGTWHIHFNVRGDNHCDAASFEKACKTLGIPGHKELFAHFKEDTGYVLLEQLCPIAQDCEDREDWSMVTGQRAEIEKDLTAPGSTTVRAWSGMLGSRQRRAVEQATKEQKAKDLSANTLEEFRAMLAEKYGNMVRAWRMMDGDGSGKLSFMEWCHACRSIGYGGDVKRIWLELDADGSGVVSLEEVIESQSVDLLHKLQVALKSRFGTCEEAWHKALDLDKNFALDIAEFVDRCAELGVPKPKRLFRLLLPGKGCKHVHLGDVQWCWDLPSLAPPEQTQGKSTHTSHSHSKSTLSTPSFDTWMPYETPQFRDPESLDEWQDWSVYNARLEQQAAKVPAQAGVKDLDLEDLQVAFRYLVKHKHLTPSRLTAFAQQQLVQHVPLADARWLLQVGYEQTCTQWLWAMRALKLPVNRFCKLLYHLLECYCPKLKQRLEGRCAARRAETQRYLPQCVADWGGDSMEPLEELGQTQPIDLQKTLLPVQESDEVPEDLPAPAAPSPARTATPAPTPSKEAQQRIQASPRLAQAYVTGPLVAAAYLRDAIRKELPQGFHGAFRGRPQGGLLRQQLGGTGGSKQSCASRNDSKTSRSDSKTARNDSKTAKAPRAPPKVDIEPETAQEAADRVALAATREVTEQVIAEALGTPAASVVGSEDKNAVFVSPTREAKALDPITEVRSRGTTPAESLGASELAADHFAKQVVSRGFTPPDHSARSWDTTRSAEYVLSPSLEPTSPRALGEVPTAPVSPSGEAQRAVAATAEASVDEASLAALEQIANAEAARAETAPAEAAPVEDAQGAASAVESASAEDAPAEAAPAEAAPVEAAPVEAAPVEAAPVEAAPAEPAPVEAAPVETAPAETAAAEVSTAEVSTAEAAPAETAPAETAAAEVSTAEAAPAETGTAETTTAEATAAPEAAEEPPVPPSPAEGSQGQSATPPGAQTPQSKAGSDNTRRTVSKMLEDAEQKALEAAAKEKATAERLPTIQGGYSSAEESPGPHEDNEAPDEYEDDFASAPASPTSPTAPESPASPSPAPAAETPGPGTFPLVPDPSVDKGYAADSGDEYDDDFDDGPTTPKPGKTPGGASVESSPAASPDPLDESASPTSRAWVPQGETL